MSDDPNSKVQRLRHDRSRWFDSDRQWAQDECLSYKARGIMAYVMSRPDDWTVWKQDLVAQSEEDGDYAVRTAIQELIDAGYGRYIRLRDPDTQQLKGSRLVLREALDLQWPETLKIGVSAGTPISRAPENPGPEKSGPQKTGAFTSERSTEDDKGQKSTNDNGNYDVAPAREVFGVEENDLDAITEAAFDRPLSSGIKKEQIRSQCDEYGDVGWDTLRATCALIVRKGWNATAPLVAKKFNEQLELIDETDGQDSTSDDDYDSNAERIWNAVKDA